MYVVGLPDLDTFVHPLGVARIRNHLFHASRFHISRVNTVVFLIAQMVAQEVCKK